MAGWGFESKAGLVDSSRLVAAVVAPNCSAVGFAGSIRPAVVDSLAGWDCLGYSLRKLRCTWLPVLTWLTWLAILALLTILTWLLIIIGLSIPLLTVSLLLPISLLLSIPLLRLLPVPLLPGALLPVTLLSIALLPIALLLPISLLCVSSSWLTASKGLEGQKELHSVGLTVIVFIDGEDGLTGLLLVNTSRVAHHLEQIVKEGGQLPGIQ